MSAHNLNPVPASADQDVDKVLESKLAELVGTTAKALARKREKGVIPVGVWQKVDGRIMYSKRRYDEWLESLWRSPRALKSSAAPYESASPGEPADAKRSISPRRLRGSQQPPIFVLV